MRFSLKLAFIVLYATVSAAGQGQSKAVDFNRDIRPILSKNCFACHGPDAGHRQADLRLDDRANVVKMRDDYQVISPRDPEESELYTRIVGADGDLMPPKKSGKTLRADEKELIRRWIEEGAPFAQHWSFVKPKITQSSAHPASKWARSSLDHYVLAQLKDQDLSPAKEADRYTLIRRLYLDLIGLPPSPLQVRRFADDDAPQAYERLVDHLLQSPSYGEHWARVWLDLARYADSTGFGSDPPRVIWRYRDWVIQALNQNMPFDQFTTEQLAGDLLPNPTMEQILATAFHRNTMTNTEGGTDDEEFRVAAVKDRAETTMQVWMGLTLRCASCHDHKFDPLPQLDYYRMYAFFNQTEDNDKAGDAPRYATPTAAESLALQSLSDDVKALESDYALRSTSSQLYRDQERWESKYAANAMWQPLEFTTWKTAGSSALEALADRSLLASGPSAATDTYSLFATKLPSEIRGLQLELLPHKSLKSGGLSRAPHNSNIVLNHFELSVDFENVESKPGRYVRIELPGKNKILSLAEVEVFSNTKNIALTGVTKQSSTDYGGPSDRAIDGKTDGQFELNSVTHTANEDNPWWEVDLGKDQKIDRIVLWNRTGGNLHQRLNGCVITVRDSHGTLIWGTKLKQAPKKSLVLFPKGGHLSIPLKSPQASFSQDNFPVANAIDSDESRNSGWALSPHSKFPQTAVFATSYPLRPALGSRLGIRLVQAYGDQHVIGRFRISTTADGAPYQVVPYGVRLTLETPKSKRSPAQKLELREYYASIAPALAEIREDLRQKRERMNSRAMITTTPVMVELATDKRRTSHLHVKGNFLSLGPEVEAATPEALHGFPKDAPRNRLGLARWLMSPENPMTSRVAVNRLWARLFGQGLVETQEDFGTQGSPPTHPGLLDWLAIQYQSSGWDTKALLKTIVMSATYRQDSFATTGKRQKDPHNRFLSRGPRFRLDAEVLRDQALALSGLLSKKMFGPSVYPHQPSGLWQAAFDGSRKWPTSRGEDRFRRGVYTFLRRTIPYPSLATFDLPSRETCTSRRIATNTPMQAFVTLNDPAWIDAARALAKRLKNMAARDSDSRIAEGIFLCTQRPATAAQVQSIRALMADQLNYYQAHPHAAQILVKGQNGPDQSPTHTAELAAWIVVANVLLNLDALMMKG